MKFHLTLQAKHICHINSMDTLGISVSNCKALRHVLCSDMGIWELSGILVLRDTGPAAHSAKETWSRTDPRNVTTVIRFVSLAKWENALYCVTSMGRIFVRDQDRGSSPHTEAGCTAWQRCDPVLNVRHCSWQSHCQIVRPFWHIVQWLAVIILSNNFWVLECIDGCLQRLWQEVREFSTSHYQWKSPVSSG